MPEGPGNPPRYSLLVLDLFASEALPEELDEIVGKFRLQFVMPVFVRPSSNTTDIDLAELRRGLVGSGGHILPRDTPTHQRALEVLTVRDDLASDWVGWLRLSGMLTSRAEQVVRALVSGADGHRSVEKLLAEHDLKARSARRWLAEAGLPSAGKWLRATRILEALLRLQADPELSVHNEAVKIGYSGTDTFSDAMFRYFGHSATKGRQRLGLDRRFHEFIASGGGDDHERPLWPLMLLTVRAIPTRLWSICQHSGCAFFQGRPRTKERENDSKDRPVLRSRHRRLPYRSQ